VYRLDQTLGETPSHWIVRSSASAFILAGSFAMFRLCCGTLARRPRTIDGFGERQAAVFFEFQWRGLCEQ
jgi:hypothetical protein